MTWRLGSGRHLRIIVIRRVRVRWPLGLLLLLLQMPRLLLRMFRLLLRKLRLLRLLWLLV